MSDTTQEHFDIFMKECVKWQEIFGLKDWYFDYDHDYIVGENEACCSMDLNAMQATITLSTDWVREPTDEVVKIAAFHEVCEVLMGGLSSVATERFNVSKEQLAEETHRVIQVLTNVLFPLL